jgi:geranylgeranyl pyrophosphate synthase
LGKSATANLATAFTAIGLAAITQGPSTKDRKIAALTNLSQMIHMTAFGQHLDTKGIADEASYWFLVNTKSSPFFGSAMYLGGILGGTSPNIANQIKQFGRLYGQMIQIHDDLNDVLAVPANSDWLLARAPLPILYAELVQHPDRKRFQKLRPTVAHTGNLREAQAILIRCGAISYAVDQLLKRYHSARKLLTSIPLIRKDIFDAALEDIVTPIRHLLVSIGIKNPQLILNGDHTVA